MGRILIVDDDLQINEILRASFEILGHTVKTVDNGNAALDLFENYNPHLTIVDMMMPGMSGIDLIKALRKQDDKTVTCLTSGLADPQLLKEALESGAWNMLSKPYSFSDLAELMRNAELLEAAVAAEGTPPPQSKDNFSFSRKGDKKVSSSDIAQLVQFAYARGADQETAFRRLPIIALELLRNAQSHGAESKAENHYSALLRDEGKYLTLEISDNGKGFPWQNTLVKYKNSFNKSRASGLMMVSSLADDFIYDAKGQTAFVSLSKQRAVQ